MTDAAKAARRAYRKKWRAEHKEAQNEYHRKWREKNRDKIKAYTKKWRAEHPDRIKQYQENYWNRKAEAAGVNEREEERQNA